MAEPRRWAVLVLALVVAVAIAACADDGGDDDGAAAAWPLVDQVPAYRKAGVLVTTGVDYEPRLGADLAQEAATLTFTGGRATFALAPERGAVAFDEIQLRAGEAPGPVWPFVITDDGALTVFAASGDLEACTDLLDGDAGLFAEFGVVGDVDGALAFSTGRCAPTVTREHTDDTEQTDGTGDGDDADNTVVGVLGSRAEGTSAFGVLLADDGEAGTSPTLDIDWLALVDSAEAGRGSDIEVTVEGLDHAIAWRSADPADDAELSILHGQRLDGSEFTIEGDPTVGFTFPRAEVDGVVRLWLDDRNLEHYVAQGPWVDLASLTSSLTIDLTPVFEVIDESPTTGDQHRRPHELQVWTGASSMERQEYVGLNWNNNLGEADRDRSAANPNGCMRTAWFGGSYVQALQTRVDQKPGLIAEAILDAATGRCHEVFSVARSLFTVETHIANAQRMVEEFGVTHLVFAVSGAELCRLHDDIYVDRYGIAADTPIHWRLVDGEVIEPVTRRDAVEVSADPDFDAESVCSFDDDPVGRDGAAEVTDKLGLLGDLMADMGADVDVTFLVLRDVLAGKDATTQRVLDACTSTGHRCVALAEPAARLKPDDLVAVDDNPYLLRYIGDGHPNPRANQHIGRELARLVLDAERDPTG